MHGLLSCKDHAIEWTAVNGMLLSQYLEELLILGSSSCNHMRTTQLQRQSQSA